MAQFCPQSTFVRIFCDKIHYHRSFDTSAKLNEIFIIIGHWQKADKNVRPKLIKINDNLKDQS